VGVGQILSPHCACLFFSSGRVVLIEMMQRMRGSDFRIFTLDTGRLSQETLHARGEAGGGSARRSLVVGEFRE
jgi:hypothetical protein